MSLYKPKGSQFWWCRFQIAGREVRRTTRTTDRREAAKRERALRVEIERAAPKKRSLHVGTLADLAGLDVERAIVKGADAKTRIPTLMQMWKPIIRIFGDIEPRKVTIEGINQYVVIRRNDGQGSATIRRELQCLKRGLVIAKRRGWILMVPDEWPELRGNGVLGRNKGKYHDPRVIARWLDAIRNEVARDEALFVLLTGLRAAEVKRVTPKWVRPAPTGAVVPAILHLPAEATKNRRDRVVGLPQAAIDIIRRNATGATDPVFPAADFKKSREAAAKRIGYNQSISLRDLRHTHSTLAVRALGDAVGVQAALGHTDLQTTQRYLTATLERAAGASAVVAGLLEKGGTK